jgi:ATP-dependent phosphofructokinase / diphosphate-dependent phosphofructokinase
MMSEAKNVVVAQSGGPSPVINSSLRGVVEGCLADPDRFGTVFGGHQGILGVLREELLNLTIQDPEEIRLLRTTPAAGAIGTCRYKLKESRQEDFERVVEVFKAHGVGYFFYIGGNDSMDTARKIADLAHLRGLDLVAVGVAKTIDNDVGDAEFKLVDHTPGYGSTARYWACNIQNLNEENRGSCSSDPVLVTQAMGRRIGFIPAAARLGDPGREIPLQIYMPEAGIGLEELTDLVNDQVARDGRVIVVLSEGFDVGEFGVVRDAFGHAKFSASKTTAQQVVVNHLNEVGLKARGSARGQVVGTDQRDTMVYASTVDLDEAHKVGLNAVRIAAEVGSGHMSTIVRRPGPLYRVEYDKVPLEVVANSERRFPREWIAENRVDVTDDFVRYARPLIGDDWVSVPLVDGIQRFARLRRVFAETRLPSYQPQDYR